MTLALNIFPSFYQLSKLSLFLWDQWSGGWWVHRFNSEPKHFKVTFFPTGVSCSLWRCFTWDGHLAYLTTSGEAWIGPLASNHKLAALGVLKWFRPSTILIQSCVNSNGCFQHGIDSTTDDLFTATSRFKTLQHPRMWSWNFEGLGVKRWRFCSLYKKQIHWSKSEAKLMVQLGKKSLRSEGNRRGAAPFALFNISPKFKFGHVTMIRNIF